MNSFGRSLRISILGESHGACVAAVLDGVPAGVPLSPDEFEADMARRRGGSKQGTTARQEADRPLIRTGFYQGHTTGAPLLLEIPNEQSDATAYSPLAHVSRPGHADEVAKVKYGGYADPRGGGPFSGRLTAALVAAGVIAKKLLAPLTLEAQLMAVGGVEGQEAMATVVAAAMADGDSVGGLVTCRVQSLPPGLGEPFFDSVESLLAHGLFAIPGIKALSFGDGWAAQAMRGSDYNDPLLDAMGRTLTNHAGGINGGITNGNEVFFSVAVRPTASIAKTQYTYDRERGQVAPLSIQGRHDTCIALRMPVVVEAVTALVLADLMMQAGHVGRVV